MGTSWTMSEAVVHAVSDHAYLPANLRNGIMAADASRMDSELVRIPTTIQFRKLDASKTRPADKEMQGSWTSRLGLFSAASRCDGRIQPSCESQISLGMHALRAVQPDLSRSDFAVAWHGVRGSAPAWQEPGSWPSPRKSSYDHGAAAPRHDRPGSIPYVDFSLSSLHAYRIIMLRFEL